MSINPVISNNSPLVALWRLDLLSLLRDLYTEVWIPREVEKEFLGIEKESRQEALNKARHYNKSVSRERGLIPPIESRRN